MIPVKLDLILLLSYNSEVLISYVRKIFVLKYNKNKILFYNIYGSIVMFNNILYIKYIFLKTCIFINIKYSISFSFFFLFFNPPF